MSTYPHPLIAREGWPYTAAALVVAALVHWFAGFWWALPFWLVALFVGGTWMHATFATFGWGNRYEAYLIVLGLCALGAVALRLPRLLDARRRSHQAAIASRKAGMPRVVGYTAI